MKILLLGMNYGSIINTLNTEFASSGHEVKNLSFETFKNGHCDYSGITSVYERSYSTFHFKWRTLNGILKLIRLVRWAEVIHIFSHINLQNKHQGIVLEFLFNRIGKRKKKFITFLGSEIRNSEIEKKINPYYRETYGLKDYEYTKTETAENSIALQKKFASLGFKAILNAEVIHYVNPQILKIVSTYYHPGKFSAAFFSHAEQKTGKIKFVHAATAPVAKGTVFVQQAVNNLRSKGYDFDFHYLNRVPLQEFEFHLKTSNVYIDQLIWGWYGIAAIQAMALGIPVVSFLGEIQLSNSVDVPIINTTVNTLEQTLENILNGKIDLKEKGRQSQDFYKEYHHPHKVARQLLRTYLN
jgi:hypothetical protein